MVVAFVRQNKGGVIDKAVLDDGFSVFFVFFFF